MLIVTRNFNFTVIFCSRTLQSCVGRHLVGYAADPSVSDTNAPDTVIGDIQKFKEMKGLYFLMLSYISYCKKVKASHTRY